MIPNYIRPQLLIRQLLEVLPQVTEPTMNAFVFGPQYELHRYNNEDERDEMEGLAYDEAGDITVPYEGCDYGNLVDKDFVKLYIEDGELSVASFNIGNQGDNAAYYHDRLKPNEIVIANKAAAAGGTMTEVNLSDISEDAGSLTSELSGRPVQSGDLVLMYDADDEFIDKRAVVSVRKSTEAMVLSAAVCTAANVETTTGGVSLSSENISAGSISGGSISATNNATAAAAFAEAGSNYGQELAEIFTFLCTKKADSTQSGLIKVRTPSNNFEGDDVVLTRTDANDFQFVIEDSGVTVDITLDGGDEIRVGDVATFVVKQNFTQLDCGSDTGLNASADITVLATTAATSSTGEITIGNGIANGSTVTIGAVTLTEGVEWAWDVDDDILAGNLATAIDATIYSAVATLNVIAVTAALGENDDATTASDVNIVWTAGTLTGGADFVGPDVGDTVTIPISSGGDLVLTAALDDAAATDVITGDNTTSKTATEIAASIEACIDDVSVTSLTADSALGVVTVTQAEDDEFTDSIVPSAATITGSDFAGGSDFTTVSSSGTYQHERDTDIVLTCVTGGIEADAVWRISDTEGLEDTLDVDATDLDGGVAFGMSGVTVQLERDDGLHRVGDSASIHCQAAGETGERSVLSLNAPMGNPNQLSGELHTHVFQVEIRSVYSGPVSERGINGPDEQWEATDDGIVLAAKETGDAAVLTHSLVEFSEDEDVAQMVPFMSTNAAEPKLFAHYRKLVPASAGEGIHRISKGSDLDEFGDRDEDNPIGLGASLMITGSQGKTIYVGRVPTDDVDGYESVLKKAENIEALYAHAPMTDDYEVQLLCKDHVALMSTEVNKKWRRAYVGTPVPGDFKVIGENSEGGSYTATVTSDGSGNVVVNDTDGKFVASNVVEGDLYRTNFGVSNEWGDQDYDNYSVGGYIVDSVVDDETLILKSGPGDAYETAIKYEVWKKDTAENVAIFMAARSSSFGSRRINNVFVDGASWLDANSVLQNLHPMFISAEIAGLRTAVVPQQGLTNTEIASVAAAPAMYIKYSEAQLNTIAANGSFIITQEYQNGPRFIRHQLTTKTDSGNLYYEDSVGVNIDEISLQVKHALRPFIGRRNVNPQTIRDIFNEMFSILASRTVVEPVLESIGPALIGFSDLRVSINDTFKDRIDVVATLNVPLPLNVIDVTLNATASFNQGELSLETLGISTITNTIDTALAGTGPVTLDLDGNAIGSVTY